MLTSKYSKIALLVLILVIFYIAFSNVLIERRSTLATFSLDGYKDLYEEGEIYIIYRRKTIKYAAFLMTEKWEENFSLQLTFPGIFGKGMRRLTLTAEDNNFIISSLTTRPLQQETYPYGRHNIPSDPDLRPSFPLGAGSGVNLGNN